MWFRTLLESIAIFLEREAGQHCVSMAVIIIGISIADSTARAQFARDLVLFGLGVLSRSMGGTKQPQPPGTTTVTMAPVPVAP